jgi:hypothetical protein
MMKTANLVDFNDPAFTHDLALDRTLLLERQMRARSVVIAQV